MNHYDVHVMFPSGCIYDVITNIIAVSKKEAIHQARALCDHETQDTLSFMVVDAWDDDGNTLDEGNDYAL
jgi:hypothetical protein